MLLQRLSTVVLTEIVGGCGEIVFVTSVFSHSKDVVEQQRDMNSAEKEKTGPYGPKTLHREEFVYSMSAEIEGFVEVNPSGP